MYVEGLLLSKLDTSVVTVIFFKNLFLIIFIYQQQLGHVSFFNNNQDLLFYLVRFRCRHKI
jgi:hypothetical protein